MGFQFWGQNLPSPLPIRPLLAPPPPPAPLVVLKPPPSPPTQWGGNHIHKRRNPSSKCKHIPTPTSSKVTLHPPAPSMVIRNPLALC